MNPSTICPLCQGNKQSGHTLFSIELGFGVVVIRNVPAQLCDQCGEAWIDDSTACLIEDYIEKARQEKRQLEVIAM